MIKSFLINSVYLFIVPESRTSNDSSNYSSKASLPAYEQISLQNMNPNILSAELYSVRQTINTDSPPPSYDNFDKI